MSQERNIPNIQNEDEILKKIMNLYIDEEIFYLSPLNKELISKIK